MTQTTFDELEAEIRQDFLDASRRFEPEAFQRWVVTDAARRAVNLMAERYRQEEYRDWLESLSVDSYL